MHCNASNLVLKILQHNKIWGGGQSPHSKFWGDLSPPFTPVIYAHAHHLSVTADETLCLLDSFVDEHRRHLFQLGADSERVTESARSDTQHAPSFGVE